MACSHLFLIFLLTISITQLAYANVPPLFVFGDSSADIGTNSFFSESFARANFPHHGIDFPNSRPTGRFSNGLITVDYIAKLLGFKTSPQPYFSLLSRPKWIQKLAFRGVNFASAGSGLLDKTGLSFLEVVPMSEQIQQFIAVCDNFTASVGIQKTNKLLSESVFYISTGSFDLDFYFVNDNRTIPVQQFIATLVGSYETYIKALYDLGARKFGILGVPILGCAPAWRVFNATNGCFEELNDGALAFNTALDALMFKLNLELPDMRYSLGNTYEITKEFIHHPGSFNFSKVDTACCGSGRLNAEHLCNLTANLCLNREQYVYWDSLNPTQAACELTAKALYEGGLEYAVPINFRQLIEDY